MQDSPVQTFMQMSELNCSKCIQGLDYSKMHLNWIFKVSLYAFIDVTTKIIKRDPSIEKISISVGSLKMESFCGFSVSFIKMHSFLISSRVWKKCIIIEIFFNLSCGKICLRISLKVRYMSAYIELNDIDGIQPLKKTTKHKVRKKNQ